MLKRIAVLCILLAAGVADARGRTVHVRGHVTKTGRYVAPHVRTAPNRSKADNWSTKGNSNPYTGKRGSK